MIRTRYLKWTTLWSKKVIRKSRGKIALNLKHRKYEDWGLADISNLAREVSSFRAYLWVQISLQPLFGLRVPKLVFPANQCISRDPGIGGKTFKFSTKPKFGRFDSPLFGASYLPIWFEATSPSNNKAQIRFSLITERALLCPLDSIISIFSLLPAIAAYNWTPKMSSETYVSNNELCWNR